VVLLVLAALSGCGGRTPLRAGKANNTAGAPSVEPPCVIDADCGSGDACRAARCEAGTCTFDELDCNDGDVCTEDSCDPAFGCVYRALVADADGDGHASPRPGFAADNDVCGDDCNDRSAAAYPGAEELCDALDNDCDGIVDNGAMYVPSTAAPTRVGTGDGHEMMGDLTSTGSEFVASYTARRGTRWRSFLTTLTPAGVRVSESPIANVNADTYAGGLLFAGGSIATAWHDARQAGNYEIYFARFDLAIEKLAPDLRLTDAPFPSLHPSLLWNQSEYLLVWDDRRGEERKSGEVVELYGQRVGADGVPIGENQRLTADDSLAERPDVALGPGRLGVAFMHFSGTAQLGFRVLRTPELTPLPNQPAPIGTDVQAPSVYWVRDRFLVLFGTETAVPGDAIWAAAFDVDGRLIAPPRRVTNGARFARSHDAISLGDRLLMVWVDDLTGNFDLYYQTLSPELGPLVGRQRLTSGMGDSVGPVVALGPAGRVGVAFENKTDHHAYLLTLACP
jgi:hypothetical protein